VDLEAFWSVGGFDPGYFMYFEDVDLAERMGRRGWLHVYAPSAVVVHEGGHSTRREPGRMLRVHHESALRYMSRQYPGRRYAPLRLLLRAGLSARLLLSHVNGRIAGGAPFVRRLDTPELPGPGERR
jgi:N-acetylglucosaminyl-diphospho-decaprenol L-rhamnosyltransferase